MRTAIEHIGGPWDGVVGHWPPAVSLIHYEGPEGAPFPSREAPVEVPAIIRHRYERVGDSNLFLYRGRETTA